MRSTHARGRKAVTSEIKHLATMTYIWIMVNIQSDFLSYLLSQMLNRNRNRISLMVQFRMGIEYGIDTESHIIKDLQSSLHANLFITRIQ